MVFYWDADNAEASGADDQAAEEQGTRTGTTDVTTDVEEEEDDDDDGDFKDEDDVDEGLQQAIENSILLLDAEDQGQPPHTDIYP